MNKYLLIAVCALIALVVLLYYARSNDNNYEHMTLGDVYNTSNFKKNDIYEKVITRMKCMIGQDTYYLGVVPKKYIQKGCETCDNTVSGKKSDSLLVLVKKDNIKDDNCYSNEMIKCINSGLSSTSECKTSVGNLCGISKIPWSCFDLILTETATDTSDGKPVLSSDKTELVGGNFTIRNGNGDKIVSYHMMEKEKTSILEPLCVDDSNTNSKEQNAVRVCRLEKTGNFQFKIIFDINGKSRYIGKCGSNEFCVNMCKTELCNASDESCKKQCPESFTYLCSYENPNDPNVLIFISELSQIHTAS